MPLLRITMHSSGGTTGWGKKHACLGLPDAFALERGQGNHTPSPGAELRQGDRLWCPAQWCRECEPVIRHLTDSFIRD